MGSSIARGRLDDASIRRDREPATVGLNENIRRALADGLSGEHRAVVVMLDVDGRDASGSQFELLNGNGEADLIRLVCHSGRFNGGFCSFCSFCAG